MSVLIHRGRPVAVTSDARRVFVDEYHGGDLAEAEAAFADDVTQIREDYCAPIDVLARYLIVCYIDPDDDDRTRGWAEYVDAVVDAAIAADEAERRGRRFWRAGERPSVNVGGERGRS